MRSSSFKRKMYFKETIRLTPKRNALVVIVLLLLLYCSGIYQYLLTSSYSSYVTWGPDISVDQIIDDVQKGKQSSLNPINKFNYPFINVAPERCQSLEEIRLLFVVKSAIRNFENRKAIRKTWGYENRFSDVTIRTIFLLGFDFDDEKLQESVQTESNEHKDIIQAEFYDTYYNNTIKAMMGLHWTFHNCDKAKYVFFVDDDYYVSARNLLRFVRSPSTYPRFIYSQVGSPVVEHDGDLYSGFVFSESSPIRWIMDKWYISLDEYPYSLWPPYATAGAYVLSFKSLRKIYYASLYTTFLRFDDVFIGFCSKKANIKPFHHSEFYAHKKYYSLEGYKWVIASHGYRDFSEMVNVWDAQRSAGNA